MQHGVYDLFKGYELTFVVGMAEAKTNLLPLIPVQTQEGFLCRPEFGKDSHTPPALSHNRLHDGSHLSEYLQSLCLAGTRLFVLVLRDARIVFDHLDSVEMQ